MDNCPVCGENSVTEDTENGQTVRVCTECGAMDNDMHELTHSDQIEGTSLSDGKAYGPQTLGSKNWMKLGSSATDRNKLVGKKLITNIGRQLKLAEHVVDEACQLYEKVFDSDLYNTFADTKKAMCLACLYSSARMADISINVRELSFFLNIKKSAKRFGAALKTLKQNYNVHLPPLDVVNEASRILCRSNLDKDILKMVDRILLIMQRALVTSGRSCTSYAIPCAYYAFKASDIVKYRRLTFKDFCIRFKFKLTNRYSCRSEVEETLKAMAMELPWLKGSDVKIKNVEVYLKDIIEYQTSLFNQAVLTAVQDSEESDKSLTEADENTVLDSVAYFRKSRKRKHADRTDISSEMEQKKQEKTTNRSYDKQSSGNCSDLNSFDLGSDDDTDLYILTPNEVLMKQKMTMELGIGLENDSNIVDVVDESQHVKAVKEETNDAKSFAAESKNDSDFDGGNDGKVGDENDVFNHDVCSNIKDDDDNVDDKYCHNHDGKVGDENDVVNENVCSFNNDDDDNDDDKYGHNHDVMDGTGEVDGDNGFDHLLKRLTNKPGGHEEVGYSGSDEEYYD